MKSQKGQPDLVTTSKNCCVFVKRIYICYNVYTESGGIYMANETKDFVLRKSGNSTIITVPSEVINALSVAIGEPIHFVISTKGVSMKKSEKKFDFDQELEKSMAQYDDLLKELVDK